MSTYLVVVESPTKAKKISSFLGQDFTVKASMGHIHDLPPDQFGVNVPALTGQANVFPLVFKPISGKEKTIRELKNSAKQKVVLCASDPDREGEAIAWHIAQVAKKAPARDIKRIEFNAITKQEVLKAVKSPRDIHMDRVKAQWARRAIDRLIGYTLSPEFAKFLGERNVSVGRVQSTVLAEIVKREREIREFVPKPFWQVVALVVRDGRQVKFTSEKFWKEEEARKHENATGLLIEQVSKKQAGEKPPLPFTSSTLQQEMNRLFKWSPEKTMQVAQRLFENGYITYHRSDSPRMEPEAVKAVREVISRTDRALLPEKPRTYKAKADAQDAHECIRPAHISEDWKPEHLEGKLERDDLTLYDIIWRRTLASQAEDALFSVTQVTAKTDTGLKLTAKGKQLLFTGWRAFYTVKPRAEEQEVLPEFAKGETIKPKRVEVVRDETKPPARYTEGTIVKWMEKTGVGRPSTYASAVRTIKVRNYVRVVNGKLTPTDKGEKLISLLEERCSWVISPQLTAEMEKKLDMVEQKKLSWTAVVRETIERLGKDRVEKAEKEAFTTTEPSIKQIELAKKLAQQHKVSLPEDTLKDRKKISAFIDRLINKGRKQGGRKKWKKKK